MHIKDAIGTEQNVTL